MGLGGMTPVKKAWLPRTAAGQVAVQLVRRYYLHDVGRDSAALTYYLLFAMFPLLIFLSNLVGFFAVDIEGFLRQLGTIIPAEVLDLLIQYLRYVSRVSSRTLMTFSLIFSIWFPMRAANALCLLYTSPSPRDS